MEEHEAASMRASDAISHHFAAGFFACRRRRRRRGEELAKKPSHRSGRDFIEQPVSPQVDLAWA